MLVSEFFIVPNFYLICSNQCKMIANDKQEKERADARNALEEYVYELRGKLGAEEELGMYVTEADRTELLQKLDSMENWLYEEGEDCNRQVYVDQLATLKVRDVLTSVVLNEIHKPKLLRSIVKPISSGS